MGISDELKERKAITQALSLSLEKHLNPYSDPRIYMAKEVTFDYSTAHAIRVDYMKFKPVNNTVSGIEKGDFYCYEIKSSVSDFNSGHGLNFIGDYNYIVLPEDVYATVSRDIPYYVGVYVDNGLNYKGKWYDLKCVKKARRHDRSRPVSEILLMMFRSCARGGFLSDLEV